MKKLLIILSVWLFAACNDIENCATNDDLDFMTVDFFDLETKTSKKVGFEITASNSPYRFTPFADSTGVGLPLDPNNTNATFFFTTDTSSFELVMRYEVQASIFDPSCDPSFTFINLDTIRQTFDSTLVVGTVTNRQLSTNVEIYF